MNAKQLTQKINDGYEQAVRESTLGAPPGSASSKDPVRKNGVLIPGDNSFEAINRFVNHVPSPEYEELQWALLGLAAARERGK